MYIGECRANLSELYFTQRQDRYVMLSACPSLADFFDRLVSCVQRYSFQLHADDTVQLADGVTCHPFDGTTADSYLSKRPPAKMTSRQKHAWQS